MDFDLLNPTFEDEKTKNKLKRLVQAPNSYFMDVKCPGCYSIATIYSHAQSVVVCEGCSQVLCKPTGGKCKLTVGSSYRVKAEYPQKCVTKHEEMTTKDFGHKECLMLVKFSE